MADNSSNLLEGVTVDFILVKIEKTESITLCGMMFKLDTSWRI